MSARPDRKLVSWERRAARALFERMLDLAGQARRAGRTRKAAAFEDATRRAVTLRSRVERAPSRRRRTR